MNSGTYIFMKLEFSQSKVLKFFRILPPVKENLLGMLPNSVLNNGF